MFARRDEHFHSFSNRIHVNRNVSFPFRQCRLFTFNPSGTPLFLKVHYVCCVKFNPLSPCTIRPTPARWKKIQGEFQAEPDPIKLWAAAQKGPRKWRNKQLKLELSQLLEFQQRQLQAWCVAANIGHIQVAKMAYAKSRRWSGDA